MESIKLTFAAKIAVATLVFATAGTCVVGAGSAYATPYGTEITKFDGYAPNGSGAAKEDNEAESGMVQSQAWDLEGFFLNGKSLTIVGGYNFYTGQNDGSGKVLTAGDIFIDTNGDAVNSSNLVNPTIPGHPYSPYEIVSNSLFKYDYVLDINWTEGTYNIVRLSDTSTFQDTEYGAQYNTPSNPWKYNVSDSDSILKSGTFNTYNRASLDDTGMLGWGGDNKHFAATFDLSLNGYDISNGALFHNTMECGNDNLIGQSAPVPEPGTMMLLGVGMLGLAVFGKRRMNKNA